MTLRALIITLRGRLLDRLLGGESLRQRLRVAEEEVARLSVDLAACQRRAEAAEGEVMLKRRWRTD